MDAVVVTHNSASDLRRLVDCEGVRQGFGTVIVVDNASTDDSVAIARAAGFTVIERPNDGFGAAVNAGAQLTKGASFAVLNPDIYFADATPPAAAEELLGSGSVGIVAPRLWLPSGEIQDSVRRVPSPLELFLRRAFGVSARRGAVHPESTGVVPWAVGACWFVNRRAFDAVGGFDPGYKLYFEDVDLCVRMHHAGYSTMYAPAIDVEHRHVAASRSDPFGWAARQHVRSAVRFYLRHPRAIFGRARYDVHLRSASTIPVRNPA